MHSSCLHLHLNFNIFTILYFSVVLAIESKDFACLARAAYLKLHPQLSLLYFSEKPSSAAGVPLRVSPSTARSSPSNSSLP